MIRKRRRFRVKAAVLALVGLLAAALARQQGTGAATLQGTVVSISDGDTLTLLAGRKQVRVRLFGIDCPEKGQPWGDRARHFTGGLAHGHVIRVKVRDRDRYGRTVGEAWVGGEHLNAVLVENGLAWAYRRYSTEFVPLERAARRRKVGLWTDPHPVPPWEWRSRARTGRRA